jgi:TrmH family RNA methyltransferase
MLSRNEVKYIQSLYHKKNRDADGVFIAEGVKIINEILHSDFKIKKIYALKDWINENNKEENVIEVTEDELKKISGFETPNKVLAIVLKKPSDKIPDLKNNITLVLDGIQDPGNMGTIIRTANWFGIKNIIASNDTADVYNDKVIKSSMGSFISVNIFYTELKQFLSEIPAASQEEKIPVYGTALDGENINTLPETSECLLIIGNEGKGIRDGIYPFIQKKISIPKFGDAESLNAAVATGIVLACLRLKM